MKEHAINPANLRRVLSYDHTTGALVWLERDADLHGSATMVKTWNKLHAGKPAFQATSTKGYKSGWVFGLQMQAHRAAWAIHYGEWPQGEIDHINGDKADNRIENLRVVTSRQNAMNRPLRCDNLSGHVGVYWVGSLNKWMAQIKVDGKQKTIGRYKTLAEAVDARKDAEQRYGYHPNHGRLIA
jgi:hypothetical protein